MSILDTTIVNVALATLGRDLHATLADIQWVLTGYMLALGAVIPVTGWAARRFGARNVYILSLALFTASSVLCGFAGSTNELILFRVLQGIGGGMLLPVGQMMMANAAGPQRMGRIMGITAIPVMLAPILGPTLGGLIVDSVSWRWIFFVNLPIGAIALVAALRILPRDRHGGHERLDIVGLVLLALGVPLVTYGLAEIGATGQFTTPACRPGRSSPALILVALFVLHALRAEAAAPRPQPLPPPDVRVRIRDDVLPRRRHVRRDDPDPALLAADPRRERPPHRPPDGPDGPRDGARHAARRPPRRPGRRRARRARRRDRHHARDDPVRLHRRAHADRLAARRDGPPRDGRRARVHAGDDRGVRLAAALRALATRRRR